MELLTKEISLTHNIYLISDFHEGTILQDKKGLEETIIQIASEKNSWAIIGGDLAEAIMIDDKRYHREAIDRRAEVPLLQYQNCVELLRPIQKKIIAIMVGNHDWKLLSRMGNMVRDFVCKELDVPYGTYSCKTALTHKGKSLYKIFYTHGSGLIHTTADDPTRRLSNMLLSLKRKLQHKAADCLVMAMGHCHKLLVLEPIPVLYLIDEGGEIKQFYTGSGQKDKYIHPDHRFYCATGSFLKLYEKGVSGYGELLGFDPHELGYCVVKAEDGIVKGVEKRILHQPETM